MIAAVTRGAFGAGYYPTGSIRCTAMYGIFACLGTCPVWVCFAVLLHQPDLLNESRGTTEADGIACGIVGRLRKGWDGELREEASAMWWRASSALWSSLLVLLGGHPGAHWPAN